jgi:hypothetical protein
MPADSQFQMAGRYPGNLDRCRRCGYPRMLHGGDGSCGFNISEVRRLLAVLVIAGGVLGGATWLLLSNPAIAAGSLAAFAFLVAIITLVIGAAVVAHRNEHKASRSGPPHAGQMSR